MAPSRRASSASGDGAESSALLKDHTDIIREGFHKSDTAYRKDDATSKELNGEGEGDGDDEDDDEKDNEDDEEEEEEEELREEQQHQENEEDWEIEEETLVPDGGWGWIICLSSFVINFIMDGTMFSFGVLLLALLTDFGQDKATTSWVGSAQMGLHMIMGPVISMMLQRFNLRQVTICGALVSSLAFIASVFSPNLYVLILTYGVIGGIGIGMSFLPAIIAVGVYFNRKRAIATGIASSGSGLGTFAYAYITDSLLQSYGWRGTVLILAALLLNCAVCGMLFRPLLTVRVRKNPRTSSKTSETTPTASHLTRPDANTHPVREQKDDNSASSGYSSDLQPGQGVSKGDTDVIASPEDDSRVGGGGGGVGRVDNNRSSRSSIGCDSSSTPFCDGGGFDRGPTLTHNGRESNKQRTNETKGAHSDCIIVNENVTERELSFLFPAPGCGFVEVRDGRDEKSCPGLVDRSGDVEDENGDQRDAGCSVQSDNEVPQVVVSNALSDSSSYCQAKPTNEQQHQHHHHDDYQLHHDHPHVEHDLQENQHQRLHLRKNSSEQTAATAVTAATTTTTTNIITEPAVQSHEASAWGSGTELQPGSKGLKTHLTLRPLVRLYNSMDHIHSSSSPSSSSSPHSGPVAVRMPDSSTSSSAHHHHHHHHHLAPRSGNYVISPLVHPRMLSSEYQLSDLGGSQSVSLYGLRLHNNNNNNSSNNNNNSCHYLFNHRSYYDSLNTSTNLHSTMMLGSKTDVHNQICKGLLKPILRKDIYYGGSVNHLPAYQHCGGSVATFMAAMTRTSSEADADVITAPTDDRSCQSCRKDVRRYIPLHLLTDKVFLLLLLTFTMWTAQSVTLTYIPDLAVSMDINRSDAAFLISIVGIANVLGRLIAGFVMDCLGVPSMWLYISALAVGALVNFAIPFCESYIILQICSALFGLCMAVAVSMRTIVLAEQLGIEVLTQSFGVVALFQGVAFSINPPVAGRLIEDYGSFKPPFLMAGIMYAVSAASALVLACWGPSPSRARPEVELEVMCEPGESLHGSVSNKVWLEPGEDRGVTPTPVYV